MDNHSKKEVVRNAIVISSQQKNGNPLKIYQPKNHIIQQYNTTIKYILLEVQFLKKIIMVEPMINHQNKFKFMILQVILMLNNNSNSIL